jgi:pimeloyl-ACP methyl ester carboxylesterase
MSHDGPLPISNRFPYGNFFKILGKICSDHNPGGPGGSGVELTTGWGKDIQKIADSDIDPSSISTGRTDKPLYFDIVSFDPRGVNNTTPKLKCFNNAFDQQRWKDQGQAIGPFGSSDVAFGAVYARTLALSETCTSQNASLLHHTNTAPVVADMVALIEAHGKWREIKAKKLLSRPTISATLRERNDTKQAVIKRTVWLKGQEKLQYWGFSYGTLLGATFAAMQPHRTYRHVIDGVVNSDDYYDGAWVTNLQDTDFIMDKFFEYCHASGPNACKVWRESPQEIQQDFDRTLESLRHSPLGIPGTKNRAPQIITQGDVLDLVRKLVYKPVEKANKTAFLMHDLINGNGTFFADHKAEQSKPDCAADGRDTGEPCQIDLEGLVSSSIYCTDAKDLSHMKREDFEKRLATLVGQSKWLGNFWGHITLPCLGWKSRPKWNIEGELINPILHGPSKILTEPRTC